MHKTVLSSEDMVRRDITKNYPSFFDAENARVLGDTKLALKRYQDFVKKNDQNATAYYNLARLQLQTMDLQSAEKNAARALKLSPNNQYFEEFYTQVLIINKKPKQAELQYEALIKKHPFNEDYLFEKAMLQMMVQDYDKAILSISELEKKMGFNEELILQKKNIYIKQNKLDLAIAEIERLKREDYSSPKYDIMIADIYETSKQKSKMEKVYQEIEKNYPNDAMAQVALAQYYLENKNNAKYNQFMQLIMKNKNLDVETKIALIIPSLQKLETDTIQRAEIIKMAASIAEESKGNKEAQSLYADVLYFSRQYDQALIEYQKYLLLDQKKFSVWSQIISIYSERQELDSVINISKNCIQYFPENAIPYFYTGISYLQQKNYDSSLIYLLKGLPLENQNKLLQSQFYSSLGDLYNAQKNYSLSDSSFEKAILLQPAEATTLNNYAYYLSLRKEKLDYAEKLSKKSLELQPNSKSFLDTYGWILFQQGNYKEALIYIQKAIDIDGGQDGTLLEHLGDVYYKLNEKDKANENWRIAKQKGETNPLLLRKIQEGKYYE